MLGLLVAVCVVSSSLARGTTLDRQKRENQPEQGGQVIDNIFNIPITAIRQTAAAAQTFTPQNTQAIDTVFQIPISTLEAVGNLVKSTTAQRRQNAEQIQQNRQERRERIIAQKERQRLHREEIQNQRLRQKQLKRTVRHHHSDPFGLNALSSLLVGHHGLLGNHGILGGHGGVHGGLGGIHGGLGGNHGGILGGIHGSQGSHGGQGSHGSQGTHGGHGGQGIPGILGSVINGQQSSYAVHEDVDEGGSFSWQGIATGLGNFLGTTNSEKVQNKIAPKNGRPPNYSKDDPRIRNKIAPVTRTGSRPRYQGDPPLENKIAPRSGRISFY